MSSKPSTTSKDQPRSIGVTEASPGAFAVAGIGRGQNTTEDIVDSVNKDAETDLDSAPVTAEVIVTAEPVDLEAKISPKKSTGKSTKSKTDIDDTKGYKSKVQVVIVGVILIVLAVILGILLNPGTPDEIFERRSRLVNLLSVVTDPVAFDPGHVGASEDRIAALKWLMSDDLALAWLEEPEALDDESLSTLTGVQKLRQRYVMAVLYYALKGENWSDKLNFLSSYDVCQWSVEKIERGAYPEYPNHSSPSKGAFCDDLGKMSEISVWWNNASGTIPDEVSYFSDSLTIFNLGGGSIEGTIPSWFENFSKLEGLSLHDNCLTGAIPEVLGSLPNLLYLILELNEDMLEGSLEFSCTSPTSFEHGMAVFSDPSVDCSCCTKCYDDFTCYFPIYNETFTRLNIYTLDSFLPDTGYVKQFQKKCMTPAAKEYIEEICPCVVNLSTEPGQFEGKCDDCTGDGAFPSYKHNIIEELGNMKELTNSGASVP